MSNQLLGARPEGIRLAGDFIIMNGGPLRDRTPGRLSD